MSEPDIDELRSLVTDAEASLDDLISYGEEHDIPAIERNATRLKGSFQQLKQNVPGALVDE